jgi:uncharacterized protein (DUF1778 family)
MAASLDGALELTPDAARRVLELIEKPPAPTPDLIRLLRQTQREVK